MTDSTVITQQVSTVGMFVGIFFHVYEQWIDVRLLLAVNVICAVFGFWLLWLAEIPSESTLFLFHLFSDKDHFVLILPVVALGVWKESRSLFALVGRQSVLRTLYASLLALLSFLLR